MSKVGHRADQQQVPSRQQLTLLHLVSLLFQKGDDTLGADQVSRTDDDKDVLRLFQHGFNFIQPVFIALKQQAIFYLGIFFETFK
jgi:hypothetical protein